MHLAIRRVLQTASASLSVPTASLFSLQAQVIRDSEIVLATMSKVSGDCICFSTCSFASNEDGRFIMRSFGHDHEPFVPSELIIFSFLQKTVIKADLVGRACNSEILATVAQLQGIKSMDIDAEKCTLTVVGTVDPVRIVQRLKKHCFAASIVSVEDDKPKEKKDPCKEACEKACKEACEKGWCYCSPGCSSYTPCPPAPYIGSHQHGVWPPPGYGAGCYEDRSPKCAIQ
ncbi:hypothetical protein ABZP36_025866 [Zizania latifolia]